MPRLIFTRSGPLKPELTLPGYGHGAHMGLIFPYGTGPDLSPYMDLIISAKTANGKASRVYIYIYI